ncbi:phosphatidylglycerophosphatase A [Nitrospirota bacterium]
MGKDKRDLRGFIMKQIATVGGIGFFPFASGTVGTVPAALLVWLLPMPWPIYVAVTVAVTIAGIIASSEVEAVIGKKDPGCIVVDEVAGYLVAMAFLPPTTGYVIAAFFLFRAFDVIKPPPINGLQKLKGGFGVVVDDLAAGLATNIVLQPWPKGFMRPA